VTIGSFCIVKDEISWIGPHLLSWLPFLDSMVFFDGESTDGTLETLKSIQEHHPLGHKVVVMEDKDPEDLKDDYVRVSNEALQTLKTDFALFLHPDMFHVSGGEKLKDMQGLAYTTSMTSYAGEPGGQLYRITSGRMAPWKNIMRLKSPDLGLHYWGHYGSKNEDMYFSAITGDGHEHHAASFEEYPYPVDDSGVHIAHLSDVRTYSRRVARMIECLRNQGYPENKLESIAMRHPRVTFKEGIGFKFVKSDFKIPEVVGEKC